jgi:hypothetical protein
VGLRERRIIPLLFEKLDRAATGVLAAAGRGVGALVGYLVGRGGNKRVLLYEAK